VSGTHRLDHVEGLRATDFSDHDAIGSETESVPEQASYGDLPCALCVRWAGFESDDVAAETKFRGVLDRDGPF
jgi:hypothetical protein